MIQLQIVTDNVRYIGHRNIIMPNLIVGCQPNNIQSLASSKIKRLRRSVVELTLQPR
jgi:hypothetical protein